MKTVEFKESFDDFVCIGDSISVEIGGTTYTATVHHDNDYSIDDDDSYNPDQNVTGCNDEQQARLISNRESYFQGDWSFCGIVISAERDGWEKDHIESLWGIELNYPGTKNEYLTTVANELLAESIEGES